MTRNLLAVGAALVTFTLAPLAAAEVTRVHHQSGDSDYFFDSEALAGQGYAELTDRLVRRPGTARVLLIRPRVEFVNELTKSVEHL
jgi:hypothetical protein